MGKFEAELNLSDMYELSYDWNGFVFDKLLDYCVKNGVFPEAANLGEVESYIAEQIGQMKGDTERIGRNTFHSWRKEGAKGPRTRDTTWYLDSLLPKIRFLHRSCEVSHKEVLHWVYTVAWSLHYYVPLTVEGDNMLQMCIERVKAEALGKDTSFCELLNRFYNEYHQILTQNGITQFHIVQHDGEFAVLEEREAGYCFIHWDRVTRDYSEVLMKRQFCLETFGDNLRTLFLGGDVDA